MIAEKPMIAEAIAKALAPPSEKIHKEIGVT